MNDLEIQRHSFEQAKNRLKEFSEKTEDELKIKKVAEDGGFFGLGDHKVTGYELNGRMETIQKHFIAVNETNNKIIREFREVYNALDVLDNDYISRILANLAAINKTSNDVRRQQNTLKEHNDELKIQQGKLDVHQNEIEKNIANISKIVTALKVFKEKLEEYQHLTDIDKIWNDCRSIQNETRVVSDSITMLSKKIGEEIEASNSRNQDFEDQINQEMIALCGEVKTSKEHITILTEKMEYTAKILDDQISTIQQISDFVRNLKNVDHLKDVDSVWTDVDALKVIAEKIKEDIKDNHQSIQAHQSELNALTTRIDKNKTTINALEQKLNNVEDTATDSKKEISELQIFKANISALNHLMEVDEIWKQTKTHENNIRELEQVGKNQTDSIQKNKEEVDIKIAEMVDAANAVTETLQRKIKYAFWLAGGASSLAIIELLLLLVR